MEFPSSPASFFETETGVTHYRLIENPNRPAVCILPGFSLPSSVYFPFCTSLAENGYTVMVMDYYGRGFSELKSDKQQYSPELYANQFIELIKELKIDHCQMVAFSFGAIVASKVTSIIPDLITRLVLVSPFKFLRNSTRPFQRMILTHPKIGPWLLSTFSAHFLPDEMKEQIDANSNPSLFWNLVSASMCEINSNKNYFVATSQLLAILDEDSIDSELVVFRNLPFKTLLIFGAQDSTIDVTKSKEWWPQNLLNVKVFEVPNSGHLCFLEQPELVMENIIQFMSK